MTMTAIRLDGGPDALSRWRQVVTRGDEGAFARRLEWDDIEPGEALSALSDLARPRELAAGWQQTFREVREVREARERGEQHRIVESFIEVARRRLSGLLGPRAGRLSPAAHATLEGALRSRLERIVSRPMFCLGPRARFDDLFEQFPVAARLCATATELWVDTSAEFMARLDGDLDQIASVFGDGTTPGEVTALHVNLSDPHGGGRSVFIVEWANGLSIVYKPRALDVDAVFAGLLAWLNERLDGLALRPLRILPRQGYGWIERAMHAPCETAEGVDRYYRRGGALLAIVYALNGADFHHENILAAGEHPVLLDLEMLLGPRFLLAEQLPNAAMPHPAARRRHVESVLNTRMLPVPKPVTFGITCESGAFSDQDRALHRPVWNGRPASASNHVEAIVAGFTAAYRAIRRNRAELLAPRAPLDRLRDKTVRFILRHTSLYLAVLDRALRAECLRSEAAFGAELDVLSKTFLSLSERPSIWPAVAHERADLAQLDVPLLQARIDSRDLHLAGGVIVRNAFAESAFEMMERRLEGMSDDDLETQVALIRMSFEANRRRDLRATRAGRSATDADSAPPLTRDGALGAATEIANAILARSCSTAADGLSWIGPAYAAASRTYAAQPLGYDVFDGYCGIALFFAALHRVSGSAMYRDAALSAVAPLRDGLGELERILRMRRGAPIGMGFGPAAAALSLAQIARLTGQPALLSDARRLAALATPALASGEDTFDFVAGSSGAAIALLSLARELEEPPLIERADAFGRHLMRSAASSVWRGPFGAGETGLAHGHAGIALALRRLGAATGQREYERAAHSAILFERGRFLEEPIALREEERTAAWARGSTGIALARLAGELLDEETTSEIETALRNAQDLTGQGVDSFCCGDAARLELLREASVQLSRPELLDAARRYASRLVDRAASAGGYDTGWRRPARCELGLFHGDAGIGLTLLRLVEGSLPSPWLLSGCDDVGALRDG
jgi:lantibiotic modifying enzyme